MGKGDIARNVFSTRLDNLLPLLSNLKLSSANSFSLEESKIYRPGMGKITFLSFGKGLNNITHKEMKEKSNGLASKYEF